MSASRPPSPPTDPAAAAEARRNAEEIADTVLEPYHGAAAGVEAVVQTMRHMAREMNPVRATVSLLKLNQADGFDCMGCAWPEPDHRSTAEFCENGAKAVAFEATEKRVGPEFFARRPIAKLLLQTDHWLESQGRLTHPMLRRPGAEHYEPVSWDEAFALIGRELRALAGPDEAAFYTSGRTSNEAAFLYQLFVRKFGTNNLPDCSNMCHESSGFAMNETLGVGKGTVQLDDFEKADAIFILGQNPGTNHPRMLSSLEAAAKRGAKIVSINPLREVALVKFQHPQDPVGLLTGGTAISTLYLQVRLNGDVALLKGIMKEVLEEEDRRPGQVLDHGFLRAHTSGFEAFAAEVRAASWDEIVAESGIARADIRKAAEIYLDAKAVIACWAMGLTQHKNAVGNIREVINLLMLRGNLGRPGAGACPVRGHSNVQGDRTMGIYEKPKPEFLDRLGRVFGFEPPRRHGLDTVETIKAMHEGRVKVFIGLGGNFHSATPDTDYTAAALRRCRLTVHVSTKLNRSHLVTGEHALILPCLGRTEIDLQAGGRQFVTVENSMSVVSPSRGHLPPGSPELLSEPAIVAGMAKATLGPGSGVDWDGLVADYDRIRDLIEKAIPGFEDFNRRVRRPGGVVLPNAARERKFHTADGKARFTVNPIPHHRLEPGQFLMMTIRTHDQYNTTVYGMDDRYRGVYNGRRVVLMHVDDIARLGRRPGDVVDLVSVFGGERRVARQFLLAAYDIPRGCVATYFPEANVLVPVDSYADGSQTPTSKSVVVEIVSAGTV